MKQVDTLDLKTVLPQLLSTDRSALAICYALQPAMDQLTAALATLQVYTAIDTLTGIILDEIAWGFNIPWYNTADTDAAKREVIKGAPKGFLQAGVYLPRQLNDRFQLFACPGDAPGGAEI